MKLAAPELNRIHGGDNRSVLKAWPENFVDSVVTDPPYELGFMGKAWDATGIAYDVTLWREVLRVMKPGAHLLAFGGTRTYHRMACAIEDAGFEIRDQIQWLYGSGFPKSLNVSMAIDKMDSSETRRERALRFTSWMRSTGITAETINKATDSYMASHYLTDKEQPAVATADLFDKLRPHLPEVPEDIEELVRWRTVESENFKKRAAIGKRKAPDPAKVRLGVPGRDEYGRPLRGTKEITITKAHTELAKKWDGWGTALKPANEPIVMARKPLAEDTVADNVARCGTGALNIDADRIGYGSGEAAVAYQPNNKNKVFGAGLGGGEWDNSKGRWPANILFDQYAAGMLDAQKPGVSRFFYVAKPDRLERNDGLIGGKKKPLNWSSGTQNPGTFQSPNTDREVENFHPTVKPVDLMAYLIQLVTQGGGIVLDPFMGSGTTGIAAARLGHPFLGVELNAEYISIAEKRIAAETAQGRLF